MEIAAFTPDSELVEFATWFSKNYPKLTSGNYHSEGKKYHIFYVEKPELFDYARVRHSDGCIEISQKYLHETLATPNFVFYTIIWCVAMLESDTLIEADYKALKYYCTTGRTKNLLLREIADACSLNPSAYATKRIESIFKQIKTKSKQ